MGAANVPYGLGHNDAPARAATQHRRVLAASSNWRRASGTFRLRASGSRDVSKLLNLVVALLQRSAIPTAAGCGPSEPPHQCVQGHIRFDRVILRPHMRRAPALKTTRHCSISRSELMISLVSTARCRCCRNRWPAFASTHSPRRQRTSPRLRAFALNVSDQRNDHWPHLCDMAEDPRGHIVNIGYKSADHVHGGLNADLLDVRIHLAVRADRWLFQSVSRRQTAREVHRHSFGIRPHRSGDRIMAKKLIRPIRSEADYDAALNEIERYFENEPKAGTPEADRFDLLALIIEDYERKRWPIEPPDTIDAIPRGRT